MGVTNDSNTTNDLKALWAFNSLYRGYENMLASHSQGLQSTTRNEAGQKEEVHHFIHDFIEYRKTFNIFFKYAGHHWPGTYVSDVLQDIFLFNIPQSNDSLNIKYLRAHYFDAWHYSNPLVLNNPLIMRQIDLYMSYFGVDDSGKIYTAIDAINRPLLAPTDKSVKDFIHEYFLVAMMNKSRNNNMDRYMQYLFNNYLEMDICDESATSADDKSRNNFYKRLRNIPFVQEGKVIPAIDGYTKTHTISRLSDVLGKKTFTVVFIWSSTCSHCEAFKPQIEAFARAHNKDLQVFAVSIDKSETMQKWATITDARKDIVNWTDVIDNTGAEADGLKNIYYMGTPSVFLINARGKILSRSLQIDTWEKIIQSYN
jgi:thiol-disulfide isomerase/thioredoxin